MSTFTTAVDNSTICTNRFLAFCVEFCPFLVLLCNGSESVSFRKVKYEY